MAKTYAELSRDIDALKVRAEAVRQKEKAGVVERIRHAILVYGLSAEELGLGHDSNAVAVPEAHGAKAVEQKQGAAKLPPVRYRDAAGNSWGGRGPKPRWLKAGLAEGRSLESFTTDGSSAAGQSASAAKSPDSRAKPKAGKGRPAKAAFASVIKYRDAAGHAWSGRGPKPGWFTAALESGKTREQLAV